LRDCAPEIHNLIQGAEREKKQNQNDSDSKNYADAQGGHGQSPSLDMR
jgi:hypothetical protein